MIAGVIEMKYTVFILTILAAMSVLLVSNVRTTYSHPVANGTAGVLLFIFLGFIFFVIPKLER